MKLLYILGPAEVCSYRIVHLIIQWASISLSYVHSTCSKWRALMYKITFEEQSFVSDHCSDNPVFILISLMLFTEWDIIYLWLHYELPQSACMCRCQSTVHYSVVTGTTVLNKYVAGCRFSCFLLLIQYMLSSNVCVRLSVVSVHNFISHDDFRKCV